MALAGHVGDEQRAREGLADAAPTVRATALGALDRLGALDGDELSAALGDPDPGRAAPGLRAGGHPHRRAPSPAPSHDADPSVVEMAAWALGRAEERAAVPALCRLADRGRGHETPCAGRRRWPPSGPSGTDAGLPAVLAALGDKPAIRRRAAVALAAFEGPEVEAALRRCLDDRDWQVRQVAEDLLAIR